jgi:hypothetical protein
MMLFENESILSVVEAMSVRQRCQEDEVFTKMKTAHFA